MKHACNALSLSVALVLLPLAVQSASAAEDATHNMHNRCTIRGAEIREGVRLNAGKAEGKHVVINWTFTDRNETHAMNLENSALTVWSKRSISRHCERSEAIQLDPGKAGLLRR